MRLLNMLRFRWRGLTSRAAANAQFDDELRFHVERETQANIARGMNPSEARTKALADFGGVERFKEQLHDESQVRWLHDAASDLRHGIRLLLTNRLYSAAVIGTLALGIGSASTIFTIVHGVLLRPLPYANAEQVYSISEAKGTHDYNSVSRATFAEWQQSARAFENIASFNQTSRVLIGAGDPVHMNGAVATASFFSVLGKQPAIGRVFRADEELPGASNVVVLGHALWRTRFGGDSNVLGKSITLDDERFTVLGVMPPGFELPRTAQYWVPLQPMRAGVRTRPFAEVIGSLKGGYTVAAAERELQSVLARGEADRAASNRGHVVKLMPLRERLVGSVARPLALLFGAVCMLLLIACANVANLALARSAARGREFAVRLALGASRWRLVRQLLIESALLAMIGGALGAIAPLALVNTFVRLSPASVAGVADIHVDGAVLFFIAGLTMSVVMLFGLAPALSASGSAPSASLSSGSVRVSGSRAHNRLRSALVVGELAIALTLVTGAGLLTRSFSNAMSLDPGFQTSRVVVAHLQLPMSRYDTSTRVNSFYDRVAREVSALPGVDAVSVTDGMPLFWNQYSEQIRHTPEDGGATGVAVSMVDNNYAVTLNIRLAKGRFFDESDVRGAPLAAVISERAARALFPNGQALGNRINAVFGRDSAQPVVVGIMRDVAQASVEQQPLPELLLSSNQLETWPAFLTVRTSLPPSAYQSQLASIVHAVDPDQPVTLVRSMEDQLSTSAAPRRFNALLVNAFAAMALLLAVVGLYALMAQSVVARTKEFGIRMALGANAGGVLSLVLREGLTLAVVGIAVGAALSWGFARSLASMLFAVNAHDPLTFLLAVGVLTSVAIIACMIPARRATTVSPITALRQD